MSSFKYYKNHYEIVRNSLFFISIIITLLVSSLIVFDIYQHKTSNSSQVLLLNHVKDEVTTFEITQAISNAIIQNIQAEKSFENISNAQLKHLIQNVMEKVENAPNKIIYTQK